MIKLKNSSNCINFLNVYRKTDQLSNLIGSAPPPPPRSKVKIYISLTDEI